MTQIDDEAGEPGSRSAAARWLGPTPCDAAGRLRIEVGWAASPIPGLPVGELEPRIVYAWGKPWFLGSG
jgi:hypothetical protein